MATKRSADAAGLDEHSTPEAKRARLDIIQIVLADRMANLPIDMLARFNLDLKELVKMTQVSNAWKNSVQALAVSSEFGEKIRAELGYTQAEVVDAVMSDVFVRTLRWTLRFRDDFINPLSGKRVATADLVLEHLKQGHIRGPDRWEQAYDLTLRLTRIAAIGTVAGLFGYDLAEVRNRTDYTRGLHSYINGIEIGYAEYQLAVPSDAPIDRTLNSGFDRELWPSSTKIDEIHPIIACIGMNAHVIRVAADKDDNMETDSRAILRFEWTTPTKTDEIRLGSKYGIFEDIVINEERSGSEVKLVAKNTQRPIALLAVDGFSCSDDPNENGFYTTTLSLMLIYVDMDATVSFQRPDTGFRGTAPLVVAYQAFWHEFVHTQIGHHGVKTHFQLLENRRYMTGLSEQLTSIYEFLIHNMAYRQLKHRVVFRYADRTKSAADISSSMYPDNRQHDRYLRLLDIMLLYDAYGMWQSPRGAGPVTTAMLTDPSFVLTPHRNPTTKELHRIFWRSPLLQCATCPSERVTHVLVDLDRDHALGQCAHCHSSAQ